MQITALISAIVVLGLGVLSSQGVLSKVFLEAETGALSQASVGSDTMASGGAYVQFGASQNGLFSFLETFDGTPSTPEPWSKVDWDVVQTSKDRPTWDRPEPSDGHHSVHNCGDVATGGTNTVDTWPKTVFKCNNHLMTSINGDVYGAIYLSPPAMADWSTGPSTIKFDLSTFTSSDRDWVDIWITPWEDLIGYPFEAGVDGGGEPARGIHISQDFDSDFWWVSVNGVGIERGGNEFWVPFGQGTVPRQTDVQGKVVRTPIEFTISSNSISMRYPNTDSARTFNISPGFTSGVVQFGHHSYNPLKGGNPGTGCTAPCGIPNTWHWDNISISPAKAFYQRQVTPERSGWQSDSDVRTLTLAEPAPANAILHFTGVCNVDIRENSSAPWRRAELGGRDGSHPEHTWPWRISIPQGTTSVQYRFQDNGWYTVSGGCNLSNPIIKARS